MTGKRQSAEKIDATRVGRFARGGAGNNRLFSFLTL